MKFKIPISESYPYLLWRLLKNPGAYKSFLTFRKMPEVIWIETTNRCNMRCRSCSKSYGLGDSKTDMDFDLFKKILSEAGIHAKVIVLTGIGEALYHKKASKIFDLLSQYSNFRLEFTTNGKLLNEEYIQKFSNLNCHITFSIDGVDNETYSLNRPNGGFERIVYSLKRIRELEDAFPAQKTFPLRRRINFLIMRFNMHQIKDMLFFARVHNVDLVIFSLFNNWGCPEDFWAEQNPLNYREELIKIFQETWETAKNIGVNIVLPHVAPLISPPEELVFPSPSKKPPHIRERFLSHFLPTEATQGCFPRFETCECYIPYNSMYIRADGKTSFCCASWHKEFGDVKTHSIASIWNNFQYRIRRLAMKTGAHTSYCRTCDLPYGLAKGNPRDKL